MQTREQLASIAVDHCRDTAGQRIQGELFIEVNDADLQWDQLRLRNIYEQQMTIWRKYGSFEVIMDEDGEVVGFVDHDKYLKSVGGLLSEAEAQELIDKAGLLPEGARLVRIQEHKLDDVMRTFRATYRMSQELETHNQVEVEINSTTREIIAVRPIPKKEKQNDGA